MYYLTVELIEDEKRRPKKLLEGDAPTMTKITTVFRQRSNGERYIVRIKKTRILLHSTRSEAFRTIQYLIPAGSENVRMVRKLQNSSDKNPSVVFCF